MKNIIDFHGELWALQSYLEINYILEYFAKSKVQMLLVSSRTENIEPICGVDLSTSFLIFCCSYPHIIQLQNIAKVTAE